MHYYTRHIGDYTKDTGHLTLMEHGVYSVLLDWSYGTERPLPDDLVAIYRICRAITTPEKKAVDSVVSEFFPLVEGKRCNKRTMQEIIEFREKSNNGRNAAAMRWHCKRNANALPTDSEGNTTRARVPLTNNQQPGGGPPEDAPEVPSPTELDQFADSWPGDMARGIPAGIRRDWAADWLRYKVGAGAFEKKWREKIVLDWRRDWLNGHPKALKNGAAPSSRTPAQRRFELSRALEALREMMDAAYELNQEPDPGDKAREKELERLLRELPK